MPNPQKIIVGLSGGVDSAVAAKLLLEQGHEVEALFMKNWEEDDDEAYCSAEEDLADATAVCEIMDIPLHTVNFASEYWDNVFEFFLDEYRAGRTPNPDILCNSEIKFKVFLEHARKLGADKIATGHYVGVRQNNGQYELLRGKDTNKDQSYFLHTLNQKQLSHSLFPLMEIPKDLVRERARSEGFKIHSKKDSTGICFIGERRFRDFLGQYLPAQPGNIQTPEGKIIGKHQGVFYYTLGQRQGLGIGGVASADESPWYVVAKDINTNILTVAQGHDHPMLFNRTATVSHIHWISDAALALPLQCTAKSRYRQSDQPCQVKTVDKGYQVIFDQQQRALTPGQSIVLYEGTVCLGGGIIEQIDR